MAQTTPSRRALVDLQVNTFGSPSNLTTLGKTSMGQKRQIQEVEEPEFAQPRSRVRVSPIHAHSAPKDGNSSGQVSHAFSSLSLRLHGRLLTFRVRYSQRCREPCPSVHLPHLHKSKRAQKSQEMRWARATRRIATRTPPCLQLSTLIPTIQWSPSRLQPQR